MTNFQYLDDFWFELDKKDVMITKLTEGMSNKDREINQLKRVIKLLETISQENLQKKKLSGESIIDQVTNIDNLQDEIEKLNKEILEKDSAIARLKAEYHELNVARLNLETDKQLSEIRLRREIADTQLIKRQLLKTLASRDREIETLKQELNTLRGVEGVGRLNTERV